MTRVLFWGDAGHTGFGTVTWDLGTRLLARGVDVRFMSMNMGGEPIPHPVGERTYDMGKMTSDGILAMIATGFVDGWHADAMIIVGDYLATASTVLATHPNLTKAFATIPTFHYVPIEGIDLPPAWGRLFTVVHPVAMSEFGADELAKILPERPPVIYHGVNTDDFYPVSANHPGYWKGQAVTSKEGAKRALRADPDSIIVLRTDRLMPRKMYGAFIRSMGAAIEQVPELRVAIHCQPIGEGGNLADMKSKLSPEVAAKIILTRGHDGFRGLSRADLNVLYNAADIYVTTSAEGFGLTPAEALATGCPVVGMDYSTLPEVVGPAGVLVPVANLVENPYDHFWATPDEGAITAAVVRLARKPQERKSIGALGPNYIRQKFSWDHSAEQFADLIEARVNRQEVAA